MGELFDTLVVFENYPVDRAGLVAAAGGLRLADVAGHDTTHYPLSLVAVPGERLQLRLDYRPDLFDRLTVEQLAARLVRLLEGAVGAPEAPIGSLEILSAAERRTILRDWNDTGHALAAATLPDLFAAQAARSPAAVAVVFEDERLGYGELEGRANQLAHHLRALGVGAESVVGLCVERSAAMVIGLLGILKAGGAYLPLDPGYPPERLAFMLEDSGAAVLVTQSALRQCVPGHCGVTVLLDADWPAIARRPLTAPPSGLHPHNTAYIIYTSGSTGMPKGVVIGHDSVAVFLRWSLAAFGIDDIAAVVASTSICFDLSVFEIFVPLCSGGRVVLASDAVHLPTAARQATLLNTVPSAIAELLRQGAIPPSVQVVNVAGRATAGRR